MHTPFGANTAATCSAQPQLRNPTRADVLLAGLAADQVRHWLHAEHRELANLADGLSGIALALARPAPQPV
ncbi:MAG: hypothetical protein ACR2J0_08480 [Mycobacteriales bacterium]